MSRTTVGPRNLGLVLVVTVVIGGLVAASSFNVKVTMLGAVLVVVAALEAVLILAGFDLLQSRRLSGTELPESSNGGGVRLNGRINLYSLGMKYTCPYCDSAFLQFIESEEQLREHIMKAHGRELSFSRKSIGQMPERSEDQKAE